MGGELENGKTGPTQTQVQKTRMSAATATALSMEGRNWCGDADAQGLNSEGGASIETPQKSPPKHQKVPGKMKVIPLGCLKD